MFATLKNKLDLIFTKSWYFLRPKNKLGLVSFVILSSLFVTAWFVFTPVAHALLSEIGAGIRDMFSELFLALAGFFIKLTFFVLKFIIEIAGYNGYIDSPAVTVGWVMIRDMTNMIFIVVLLIISFGTILGLEHYEWKKMLVKVIFAAVVVNFSRIICGAIIDIGQIVMLTFVNGIAATASGNLVNMFNVQDIFKLGGGSTTVSPDGNVTFLASVAALVFGTMMLVTMATFLLLLMARMAMLWVLIVLSPFAFVLNVLPQTEKYASQWWGEFGGNVIAGPIVVFSLWLSFVTVGTGTVHDDIKNNNALKNPDNLIGNDPTDPQESTGITSIMSWEKMANFVIAIAMLLAGAKMASELGAAGGEMMGKAKDIGKKVAMYASGYQAARWGAGKAWEGTKLAGKGVYYGLSVIPGINAIHPERWKQRAKNIQSRAKSWYNDRLVKGTIRAGEIAKTFRVNKKGQYIKGTEMVNKVDDKGNFVYQKNEDGSDKIDEKGNKIHEYEEEKDKDGNILKDKNGNVVYQERDILQKGFWDGLKRFMARGELEVAPGFGAFRKAYSEDLEAIAEAKHEQLDHLASTSSLPVGLEKQKAQEWLEFLEHTGGEIKAGKKADIEKLREDIMHIIEHGKEHKESAEEVDKKLKGLGLSDLEIYKAKEGFGRFGRSMDYKASAKVIKENMGEEHKKAELKALQKYLGKAEGVTLESKTAKLKAGTKQIEDKIQSQKELEELKEIKKLLEGKGKNVQQVVLNTKAEIANIKESTGVEEEERVLRARSQDYLREGTGYRDEEKAEAYAKRADALPLEKAREATKNLSGDELAARAVYLATQIKTERGKGPGADTKLINNLIEKLFVARSTAMTQPAWIGPYVDRVLEQAIGMTQAQKADMTPQQYSLSLDTGEVIDDLTKLTDEVKKLEANLGGGKNQAFLRDRRLGIESAMEKFRHEVAGTLSPNYENGQVTYSLVSGDDRKKLLSASDNEYPRFAKGELMSAAYAPLSNLGRNNDGNLTVAAASGKDYDLFLDNLASLTANHFGRITKIVEDLKRGEDTFQKRLLDDFQARLGDRDKGTLELLKKSLEKSKVK